MDHFSISRFEIHVMQVENRPYTLRFHGKHFDCVIPFSPRQFRIMLLLLQQEHVTDAELHRVNLSSTSCIEQLRAKLTIVNLSIHRIHLYGYILSAIG